MTTGKKIVALVLLAVIAGVGAQAPPSDNKDKDNNGPPAGNATLKVINLDPFVARVQDCVCKAISTFGSQCKKDVAQSITTSLLNSGAIAFDIACVTQTSKDGKNSFTPCPFGKKFIVDVEPAKKTIGDANGPQGSQRQSGGGAAGKPADPTLAVASLQNCLNVIGTC